MKRLLPLFIFFLLLPELKAQAPFAEIGVLPSDNYFVICDKAEAYFQRDYVRAQRTAAPFGDDEYRAFERWKWYWKTRVDENGNFPDLQAVRQEAEQLRAQQAGRAVVPAWTNISQTSCTGGYNGMGRATCIAFDPSDINTFYVGAPIGGLWKTTDAGQTYTPLTDALPYVSVGSCVVDYNAPATLYISVGDHSGWWNFSLGVYKSTDGGATWAPTGLSWTLAQNRAISMLAMDPFNSAVIYAATSNGLYKTTDSGANWTVVRSGYYSDIRFESGTSNIYAALHDYWGSSEVFRSTDGGATWTQLSNFGLNYNWIRLSVTPANAAKLAVINTADNSLYVSSNYGSNLTFMSNAPEDATMMFSPTNANVIYCGSLFVNKSTDNGATWNQLTYWYYNPPYDEVHADQRNVAFHPLYPDHIFFCNDGGLYRYAESNGSWLELTDGLRITQFYKISCSQNNAQIILGGTQDNGGRMRTSLGTWKSTNGGDAMEVAIDPTNDNTIYTTYIYGQLYRSYDGWTNDVYNDISANIPGGTPPGSWVTPYMLDPSDQNTIIAAYDDVWMSNDQGNNWTALSSSLAGGNTFTALAVAASAPNTIYVSEGNTLYITHDLGSTWTSAAAPGTAEITSIAVHPDNANLLWISRGGYSGGSKVYVSVNGGLSWSSLSAGLPNIPVNVITFVNNANGGLFIGTEAGIYYRDSLNTNWQTYGTGLPNTSVTDIEIQYPTGKIRAATYGRGIWETTLSGTTGLATAAAASKRLAVFPNPSAGEVSLRASLPAAGDYNLEVLDITGRSVFRKSLRCSNVLSEQLDLRELPKGIYTLKVSGNGTVLTEKITLK